MTPQQFIAKWRPVKLTERSACQQHFLDFCELLGQEKPAEADPEGAWYTFERGVRMTQGGQGWADVWRRGCFGWEHSAVHERWSRRMGRSKRSHESRGLLKHKQK